MKGLLKAVSKATGANKKDKDKKALESIASPSRPQPGDGLTRFGQGGSSQFIPKISDSKLERKDVSLTKTESGKELNF
jgi:hypothetical protein